jgi:hypothetical protein
LGTDIAVKTSKPFPILFTYIKEDNMKNPNRLTILLLLISIMTVLVLIAKTDLMAPVMQFILATDRGTPFQIIGCILAAILALWFVYVLLNMVGKYYSAELDVIEKEKLSTQGGEQLE